MVVIYNQIPPFLPLYLINSSLYYFLITSLSISLSLLLSLLFSHYFSLYNFLVLFFFLQVDYLLSISTLFQSFVFPSLSTR